MIQLKSLKTLRDFSCVKASDALSHGPWMHMFLSHRCPLSSSQQSVTNVKWKKEWMWVQAKKHQALLYNSSLSELVYAEKLSQLWTIYGPAVNWSQLLRASTIKLLQLCLCKGHAGCELCHETTCKCRRVRKGRLKRPLSLMTLPMASPLLVLWMVDAWLGH